MIIYVPCKLSEQFVMQEFKDWEDGKRIYIEGANRTFKGFDAFDCNTHSLSIPTIYTESGFLSYDHLGEFPQEFIPKYKISIDVKSQYKLSDKGFPSGKTVRLCGIVVENGYLLADFVTNDRHEHLQFVIKDTLQYAKLDENTTESILVYDCEGQKKKSQMEAQSKIRIQEE